MSVIRLTAKDGSPVEFNDKIIGAGGMKDVYFCTDKSCVVCFFRAKQDANARDRLENIVGRYRQSIFGQTGGDYWKDLYCWPERIVEWEGKLGIVVPTYAGHFFFRHGSVCNDSLLIKGKEKEGKWFASPFLKYGQLSPNERGEWFSYLRICIKIARGVRRMHAAGLAHSDLSYKNVLVDPITANASIIDIDGLVVPGKFAPDVVGTPDFIAPEVMQTLKLNARDPNRKLPSRQTDQHALAVLIYMYLLNRHPLRGRKIHDCDDINRDEELAMGQNALFIEHDSDTSNRYDTAWVKRNEPPSRIPNLLPWQDLDVLPYKALGPYLAELVKKAFEEGLHNPGLRPSADDWETALVKTSDLIQQCANPTCPQKWFPFNNSTRPVCPFCRTPFRGILPILNLYYKQGNSFRPDNHRVMVYNGVRLYAWHVNRRVFPNERLTPEQKQPVGYFQFYNGQWFLVNKTLQTMKDITDNGKPIVPDGAVQLTDGRQILLSEEDGGRLIQVQMVQC
ncbi:MAG: serine/threonine-protein kinase [Lentisphaerae bacterium ADurb.Bin242]|nr:MAG: serine/threonine-protein kinase [Lentisphaerae bacterium ADurb.Bin242]